MDIVQDNISCISSDSNQGSNTSYTCECGKRYKQLSNLSRHKKTCPIKVEKEKQEETEIANYENIIRSLKEEIYNLKEQIDSQQQEIRQSEKDLIKYEMKIEYLENSNKGQNELIKTLLDKSSKDISTLAENRIVSTGRVVSNTEKPKKRTFDSYVLEECQDCYTIPQVLEICKSYFDELSVKEMEDYFDKSHFSMFDTLIDYALSKISKEKFPIKVKTVDLKEGYIEKEKLYSENLSIQVQNKLINRIQSILDIAWANNHSKLYNYLNKSPGGARDVKTLEVVSQKIQGFDCNDLNAFENKKKKDKKYRNDLLTRFIVTL